MKGLTEVMFEQRPERDEGGNPCVNLGKEHSREKKYSKCKGLEAELYLVWEGTVRVQSAYSRVG